jgi:hypothetical protein
VRPLLASVVGLTMRVTAAACRDSDAGGGGDAARPGPPDPAKAQPATVAPTDKSPPKKPPPLRLPRPPIPALPDLPELSGQERGEEAPRDAHLDDEPCRAVWSGSAKMSLSCAKSLTYGAKEHAGAEPLVARSLLSRSPETLPQVVDHRLEGTEGPIRNQTTSPSCTAFSEAAALDHALARWSGRPSSVSVMQIWARYHSPSQESALMSNVTHPIGDEHDWPFSANEAAKWVPCDMASRSRRGSCGHKVDEARVKQLEDKPIGEFTEVEYLGKADVTMLEAKIAAGQDVILAFEVPSALVPKGKPGSRYLPHYTRTQGSDTGHSLLLAGYANYPHGAYFLAHNSWGSSWGDGGYAWIHMATISKWGKELVAVDAEPREREAGKRPPRVRGAFACGAGLVPDSIGGQCSAPCPDHSPRHDEVCAVAGECPKDYVNLTGECVLAAPSATGRDKESGIAWTCGAGGCSYTLPKSEDPACTGQTCQTSCPAPDFHVAQMGKTLVCIE